MKDPILDFGITWILCMLSLWGGHWMGYTEAIVDTREVIELEAKEAGVGEFYLDTNEEKQFRWITNDEK